MLTPETVLLSEADRVNKVDLNGKKYHAKDLVRCIIDWPCKLDWDDGLQIKSGDWENWMWFRENFLKPNQKQVMELFSLAESHHERKLKKYFKQQEIFGEG